jgi:hypothetical protein
MSLERSKPTMLPPLKDALLGAVDAEGVSTETAQGAMQLPKIQRPPPVLDDNLWDEITTEVVKRKSMHEVPCSDEDSSQAQALSPTSASTSELEAEPKYQDAADPAASEIVPQAEIGMSLAASFRLGLWPRNLCSQLVDRVTFSLVQAMLTSQMPLRKQSRRQMIRSTPATRRAKRQQRRRKTTRRLRPSPLQPA